MANKKRKFFLTTSNKYQERIVLLTFIPALIILVVLVVSILFAREELIASVKNGYRLNYATELLSWASRNYNYVICGLCGVFVLAVSIAFKISHDLMGAFTRIIPELDEIIAGRSQRLLTARPEDELANELLKRINVLVKSYIEHKK